MTKKTFHIQWHITNFCNLKCLHCYQDDFTAEEDLSFSEVKIIFENITSFLEKTKSRLVIDITGGEPLLYKKWKKLLEFIYNSPYVEKMGLITNGLFLNEENIEYLKNFPCLELKISAEGFSEESYEFFRGKNNFVKLITALELLKESNFEKTIMFTLLNSNYPEIKKAFDFAVKYKIHNVIIERFIPWGKGNNIKNKVITLENWKRAIKILVDDEEDDLTSLLPYKGFMMKIKEDDWDLLGAPCIIGKDGIAIMPDGSVFPCRRFPLKVGNLLEEALVNIWENSSLLEKLRNKNLLKGKCRNCTVKDCSGCRALSYSLKNDYLEEDPLCFY